MISESGVVALVLLAAALHATWNALLKSSDDGLLSLSLVVGTQAGLSLPVLAFVEPPPPESWPYLAGSVAAHAAYYCFLTLAYRYGDLSQAYPIARGTSPLVVAAFAGLVAGEVPTAAEGVGVTLVSAGIIGIAIGPGMTRSDGLRPLVFAVATGLLIGVYMLIDGLGVRAAGESRLGYIAWLFAVDAVPIVLFAAAVRRARMLAFIRSQGARNILGGVMATLAYGLVIWAMSLSRLAGVAALREVSVILAAILGTAFLNEPFGRRRVMCSAIVAAGIVVLNL